MVISRRLVSTIRFRPAFFVSLALACALAGCRPAVTDPNDPKFIVAEAPGWKVTRADLNHEVDTFLKTRHATREQVGPAKLPMIETALIDELVLRKLLLAKAAPLVPPDEAKQEADELAKVRARFPTQAEFNTALGQSGLTPDEVKQRIHDTLLLRLVFEKEAFKNAEPTDADILAFYKENQGQFKVPLKVRVSRVLIVLNEKEKPADKKSKKAIAQKAYDRIAKGADFAKVAGEVSEDRSSKIRGGDMGWVPAGENEPEFDRVAFSAKVGTLSPVFETPLGYQFLRVTDIQPAGFVSMADVRPKIAEYLRQAKREQAVDTYTKAVLRDDKTVVYHLKKAEPIVPVPGAGAAPVPPTSVSTAPVSTVPVSPK